MKEVAWAQGTNLYIALSFSYSFILSACVDCTLLAAAEDEITWLKQEQLQATAQLKEELGVVKAWNLQLKREKAVATKLKSELKLMKT